MSLVFRVLWIVISIGLADSLNPTTIAPALYLACGEHARKRVLEFTAAVFLVYFVGGLLLTLGPGRLIISLVPIPRHTLRYGLELAAGILVLVVALLLWRHRAKLADRDVPDAPPRGKTSWLLGATITAVELPTAFPYFAAIAAIVGGPRGLGHQVVLLLVFNVCFILPLLCILATLTLLPGHAGEVLARGRAFLSAHWPRLLAGVGLLVGVFILLLGSTGLIGSGHGDFARFVRGVHRHIPRP
jgi:cytochrome c biogenesis protein CcdA